MILLIAGVRFILYFHPFEMITLKINITKALIIFPFFCIWLPFFSQEPIWSKSFLLCSEIGLIKHWRTNNGPQKNNQATIKENEIFWSQEVGKSMHIREVFQKKWLFFMTFTIKRRTPPPLLMALFSTNFFPHFFSFVIESYISYTSYIYETDFTLCLSQKCHF